jgi:hypothetical protein
MVQIWGNMISMWLWKSELWNGPLVELAANPRLQGTKKAWFKQLLVLHRLGILLWKKNVGLVWSSRHQICSPNKWHGCYIPCCKSVVAMYKSTAWSNIQLLMLNNLRCCRRLMMWFLWYQLPNKLHSCYCECGRCQVSINTAFMFFFLCFESQIQVLFKVRDVCKNRAVF